MEVGAVKQAFNNELILIKKNLNQAKLQTIHKLTRKAKTLIGKKAPEKLKEKLKRKSESAVSEVLIIKKIKPKEIAKFAVTHKGELKDFLNKPKVDEEKACARLLLHKSLQEKYKFLRNTFTDISIADLFMSREERRKLKKEAKDKQKNKKNKEKDKPKVKPKGNKNDFEIEDIDMNVESVKVNSRQKLMHVLSDNEDDDVLSHEDLSGNSIQGSEDEFQQGSEKEMDIGNESDNGSEDVSENEQSDISRGAFVKAPISDNNDSHDDHHSDVSEEAELKPNSKPVPKKVKDVNVKNSLVSSNKVDKPKFEPKFKELPKKTKKNLDKKSKEHKNKNFNEKILQRKFKKDSDDVPLPETKIVDPFFRTSTGENYISIVEPRQPDEIKDVHKQGNRKLRRAVMFGHVPKSRLRQNFNDRQFDDRRNNSYNNHNNNYRSNNDNKNRHSFNDKSSYKDNQNYNDKGGNKFDSNSFNRRNDGFDKNVEAKPEKLHPSWEAKKKQSGILPYQGKKIVFDES